MKILRAILAITCLSSITLSAAWYYEFVLGYAPCGLCLRQRLGHYVLIPVGFVTTAWGYLQPQRARTVAVVGLIVMVFAATFSLYWAGFHIGVEQNWWAGLDSCGGGMDTTTISIEQWLNPEGNIPGYVPCNQPTFIFTWLFGGISMAVAHFILMVLITSAGVYSLLNSIHQNKI